MANVVQIVLRAVDQTKQGFTAPIKNLSDLGKAADRLKPAFVAMAATVGAAFSVMAKHAVNNADEMRKLAQQAGTTTEIFSSWAYVAGEADLQNEKLVKSFKEISKHVEAAKNPLSESAQLFSALNITAKDASGVMLQLSDRFTDTADDTAKVTAATKLFGDKLGAEMIPFLNQGSKAIRELQEEAKLFGLVIDGETGKAADEFNDNLTKLKQILQGIVTQVVSEFLPAAAQMLTAFVEWIKETNAIEFAVGTLIDIFKTLAYVVKLVITAFGALSDVFTGIGTMLAHLASSFVDFWGLVGTVAGNAAAAFEEVIKGNFSNAETIASQAMARIKQDAMNFLGELPKIAQAGASGFAEAFKTLSNGPVAPTFGEGRHGAGTEDNPITVGKGSIGSTSTGNAGFLPSGFTMEAYDLDQQMMLKTKEMLFELSENKTTLTQRNIEQMDLESMRSQMMLEDRMRQISALGLAETDNFTLIEKAFEEHATRMKIISDRIAKNTRASYMVMADSTASILGSMAQVAQAQGKKSFALWQGLSYAQALVSTFAGAARAFAEHSWPMSAFVAAAVTAQGMAQVASIAATKPPQAHAGAGFIPEEATYLLSRGERVLAPEQNQDLTAFLSGQGGGPTQVSIYLDGEMLGKGVGQLSRDGRLEISARAIV